MKILIGIKHVPDTETKVKIGGDGKTLDESGVKWVISPYDEFALEEGLRIRDARGAGEVIAVCAGREASQTTLRQAMAMGADRAILIQDPRFERCDALARAGALAAAAKAESAELLLLGKLGVGTDEGQTGPMTAELLGWPHVAAIGNLELGDGSFTARRAVEGAVEVHEGKLPAVFTCDKGLNEPRYASLKGIMQAKKKPLEVKTPDELGIDAAALERPALVWESIELPPARSTGVVLDGPAEEAAGKLANLLRDEAKVI